MKTKSPIVHLVSLWSGSVILSVHSFSPNIKRFIAYHNFYIYIYVKGISDIAYRVFPEIPVVSFVAYAFTQIRIVMEFYFKSFNEMFRKGRNKKYTNLCCSMWNSDCCKSIRNIIKYLLGNTFNLVFYNRKKWKTDS